MSGANEQFGHFRAYDQLVLILSLWLILSCTDSRLVGVDTASPVEENPIQTKQTSSSESEDEDESSLAPDNVAGAFLVNCQWIHQTPNSDGDAEVACRLEHDGEKVSLSPRSSKWRVFDPQANEVPSEVKILPAKDFYHANIRFDALIGSSASVQVEYLTDAGRQVQTKSDLESAKALGLMKFDARWPATEVYNNYAIVQMHDNHIDFFCDEDGIYDRVTEMLTDTICAAAEENPELKTFIDFANGFSQLITGQALGSCDPPLEIIKEEKLLDFSKGCFVPVPGQEDTFVQSSTNGCFGAVFKDKGDNIFVILKHSPKAHYDQSTVVAEGVNNRVRPPTYQGLETVVREHACF